MELIFHCAAHVPVLCVVGLLSLRRRCRLVLAPAITAPVGGLVCVLGLDGMQTCHVFMLCGVGCDDVVKGRGAA
jgi:hypothetical protein